MNNRLTIQDLADMLAERTGKDRKNTELFLKEFITLLTKGVYTDKIVKVKGIGTFKIILVERRESIHVNTGERFIIPEHYKFSFLPDKELKDLVNKPFSFFETTELNDDVEFSDLDESLEDSRDADPEDESIEEVLPDKEAAASHGIEEPIEIQGPIGMSERILIGKKLSPTVDRLTPPEELVGEIYRPGQSSEKAAETVRSEVAEGLDKAGTSAEAAEETAPQETLIPPRESSVSPQEISTPLHEAGQASSPEEVTAPKNEAEESYPPASPATQPQPVQSDSYTLREDRITETARREAPVEPEEEAGPEAFEAVSPASEKEETGRPEDFDLPQAQRFTDPLDSESPKNAKITDETSEAEEPEDDNPYDDDFELAGENRRPSREGASFKKSVVLFFIVAILLIAGAYAYLNKDLVSGLIRGVPVPPIDTTDVSDLYAGSEEATEEEIREIAEAHAFELPAPEAESDSLSAAAGNRAATPDAESAAEAVPSNGPSDASVRETPSSRMPSAAPVSRPAAPAQNAAKPGASAGKTLGVVKIEPGDRLTLISLKYYGNKIFWVYLYEHNKSRIHDPNNVPIGTEIEVPAPELYGIDAHSRESIKRASVKQTEILTGE